MPKVVKFRTKRGLVSFSTSGKRKRHSRKGRGLWESAMQKLDEQTPAGKARKKADDELHRQWRALRDTEVRNGTAKPSSVRDMMAAASSKVSGIGKTRKHSKGKGGFISEYVDRFNRHNQ